MIEQKSDGRERLERRMRSCSRGDEIRLDELEAILGVKCTHEDGHSASAGYGIARRAAKFIEAETLGELYFRWDRERMAWRALRECEIPDAAQKTTKKIRRASKSTARICSAAIQGDSLQGAERDRAICYLTVANAIYTVSSRRVVEKTLKMIGNGAAGAVSEEDAIRLMATRK